jgi:hypothetical protein
MKKAVYLLLIFAFIIGYFGVSPAADEPYDLRVKTLYAAPGANNKVVYDIPIDVKMLDISDDMNWYKVKIQFNLGPACFKYTGWAYIPVGQILAERYEKSKIAATLK